MWDLPGPFFLARFDGQLLSFVDDMFSQSMMHSMLRAECYASLWYIQAQLLLLAVCRTFSVPSEIISTDLQFPLRIGSSMRAGRWHPQTLVLCRNGFRHPAWKTWLGGFWYHCRFYHWNCLWHLFTVRRSIIPFQTEPVTGERHSCSNRSKFGSESELHKVHRVLDTKERFRMVN